MINSDYTPPFPATTEMAQSVPLAAHVVTLKREPENHQYSTLPDPRSELSLCKIPDPDYALALYGFHSNPHTSHPLSSPPAEHCISISSSDEDCSYPDCSVPTQKSLSFIPTSFSADSSVGGNTIEHSGDSYAFTFDLLSPEVPRKKLSKRSTDLVRAIGLTEDEQLYSREIVRRTRMLYDALRISTAVQEEKRRGMLDGGLVDVAALEAPQVLRRHRPKGHLMASRIMRMHDLWLNRDKRIVGTIPGIEVGDIFFHRMELCVVGLHGQVQAGIDYLPSIQSSNGQPIATSIIVSGGYEDDEDAGNVLIYTGHGGQDKFSKQCMDQKLEGGNLALERSMFYGIEVRVIRGFKHDGCVSSKVYVYDGLYIINKYWFEKGKSGYGVYKYKLSRVEGQVEMGSHFLKLADSLKKNLFNARPKGYISLDLSKNKESVPVLLFNDMDKYQDPVMFEYLAKAVFPPHVMSNNSFEGCECVSSCTEDCFCAKRNGGEFAYDQNGFLCRGKPIIYECGPSCRCPQSCINRVTQKGLRRRLEIYRSETTAWAVRSLDLIEAGTFICEYTGVVLTKEQARVLCMNGDSLVYPHRFAQNWTEWGDLSKVYPNYQYQSFPPAASLDFAMDISRMRNVACYFSHSSLPNVFVQRVLYDHNDLMFPHLMLFALESIPPLKDLCLDYGVPDDQGEWANEILEEEKLAICH